MTVAYLGLGSNIGDGYANLKRAMELLEREGVHTLRRSSLYETEPQDMVNQPWFLNLVIETEVRLFPRQLLARVLKIESEMGRNRIVPKGPRIIDIDILLYGRAVIDTAELTIPHREMANRRFVLEPLAELAPQLQHPLTGRRIADLLPEVQEQMVRRAVKQDF